MWRKLGRIIDESFISGFSVSHAAIPFAFESSGGLSLYFSSRDERSRSRGFVCDLKLSESGCSADPASVRQALGPGDLGAFDDSGAMPSWIVEQAGRRRLYYTGWSLGKTVPFYFYIGLAESSGGSGPFQRVSRAPVLGRNPIDPFLTASPCVLVEGGLLRMWYVSGQRWEERGQEIRHYYFIRYAESKDGIAWSPAERPSIDFAGEHEYAMGRPCVVKIQGGYAMWFAVRGEAYRMGFAISRDGLGWTRRDELAGLAPSPEGWDSAMVAYAHVFAHAGRWWMLYNGNDYGRSGIGVAVTATLPSFDQLSGQS